MKKLKYLFCLLFASLTITSCGGDDNDGGGGGGSSLNVNKNIAKAGQTEVERIEFPHLDEDGNSVVIVHKNNDSYGVNYCVEWDTSKKSQRWSCYILTAANKNKNTDRYYGTPQYPEDPSLTSSQRLDKDYIYGSGFDHGHICPSQDRLYSSTANYQTFYMTNMQPQYSVFNGSSKEYQYKGLWINMENFVHDIKLGKNDTLYVCKGGTIRDDQILKKVSGKLIVPKYFFAAILLKKSGEYKRALGFWFEHTNVYHGDDALSGYTKSIDELEQLTGIDFFCNLPDDIENKVESKSYLKDWGLD